MYDNWPTQLRLLIANDGDMTGTVVVPVTLTSANYPWNLAAADGDGSDIRVFKDGADVPLYVEAYDANAKTGTIDLLVPLRSGESYVANWNLGLTGQTTKSDVTILGGKLSTTNALLLLEMDEAAGQVLNTGSGSYAISGTSTVATGEGGPFVAVGATGKHRTYDGASKNTVVADIFDTWGAAYTITFWFKVASGLTVGPFLTKTNTEDFSEGLGVYLGAATAVGGCSLDIYDNLLGAALGSAVMSTDEWHHVVLTWDGTDRRLYVDGSLQLTLVSPTYTNYDSPLYIGGSDDMGYLACEIDQFAVYTGKASASTVAALYAKRAKALPATWWKPSTAWIRPRSNPIFGSRWSGQMQEPHGLRVGDEMWLYYTVLVSSFTAIWRSVGMINQNDTITWATPAQVASEEACNLWHPRVFYSDVTELYYLFYSKAVVGVDRFCVRTSADGATFGDEHILYSCVGASGWPYSIGNCMPYMVGSAFKMHMDGQLTPGGVWKDGIWSATLGTEPTPVTNFTLVEGPIAEGPLGSLLTVGDRHYSFVHLQYGPDAGLPSYLALYWSDDMVTWTAYAGNPILVFGEDQDIAGGQDQAADPTAIVLPSGALTVLFGAHVNAALGTANISQATRPDGLTGLLASSAATADTLEAYALTFTLPCTGDARRITDDWPHDI